MFARLFPLLLSGCATSWIITQAAGGQRALDEGVHDVHVPQPGVEEHLTVTLPLAPQSTVAQAGQTPTMLPFALTCAVAQSGHDIVYHQAFRYGSRWKKTTAIAFFAEGAIAALGLLTATADKPAGYLYGGFFAADAVLTAPLFFIPRKEIYRSDDVAVTTPVRSDCPDGLALEIGSDTFPIGAAGTLGELGETALGDWMNAPNGPLRVDIAGQARDLPIDDGARCTWQHNHGGTCMPVYGTPVLAAVTIPVAAGTLTSLAP
jgi:hypothetical protein